MCFKSRLKKFSVLESVLGLLISCCTVQLNIKIQHGCIYIKAKANLEMPTAFYRLRQSAQSANILQQLLSRTVQRVYSCSKCLGALPL